MEIGKICYDAYKNASGEKLQEFELIPDHLKLAWCESAKSVSQPKRAKPSVEKKEKVVELATDEKLTSLVKAMYDKVHKLTCKLPDDERLERLNFTFDECKKLKKAPLLTVLCGKKKLQK